LPCERVRFISYLSSGFFPLLHAQFFWSGRSFFALQARIFFPFFFIVLFFSFYARGCRFRLVIFIDPPFPFFGGWSFSRSTTHLLLACKEGNLFFVGFLSLFPTVESSRKVGMQMARREYFFLLPPPGLLSLKSAPTGSTR